MKAFLHSRRALAVLLFIVVGVIKLPLEERLSDNLRAQNLQDAPMDVNLFEEVGQMAVAAFLGGLRPVAANIAYLFAYGAFEEVRWNDVAALMGAATRFDPHNSLYWEEASWHMAYNAASYYKRDRSLRPAVRNKLVQDYELKGVEILKEGLQFLPGNPKLLLRLGQVYQDKLAEPRKAAEAFLACYANGGPTYAERMGAYELTKLSDRASWEKAYEILKRYYDMGMKKRGTTIMTDLPILEERLNIPLNQRAKAADDDDLPRRLIQPPRPNAK